jgi:uncharacterized protein
VTARTPFGGAAVGMLLLAVTACAGPAPEPLPTTTAAPLEVGDGVPAPAPTLADVDTLVRAVVADAEAYWSAEFAATGLAAPQVDVVVLQPGDTFTSGCSWDTEPLVLGSDSLTAIYCTADGASGTIIVPAEPMLGIWTGDAEGMTGAAGDFAVGFVVGHEFGHHIADELAQQLGRPAPSTPAADEFLADCFAGVWTFDADGRGMLEAGDLEEALALIDAVGATTEENGWGTAEERRDAFLQGYEGMPGLEPGDADACIGSFWT